jgi:hypothetical protein
MRPCASYGPSFGSGRRRTQRGRRASGGLGRSPHARSTTGSARELIERLHAALFAPLPDSAQDLIDKYGITAEQAGDGSPDLEWLDRDGDAVHCYGPGDRLPVGIEAYAGREDNDLVLRIESFRAVVAGDSLVDFGSGLALNERLRGGVTRELVLERLRPILRLPVEVVLPAHGTAADRAALERALR